MKKSFKFFFSIFALNLLLLGSVFAQGYHVCVASYKQLKNAENMVQKLEKQSVSAVISESKVNNQSYYRVLLEKEFKKIDDARKYRDEVKKYSFVKELGLKDFWVCKSDKILSKKAVVKIVTVPAPVPKVEPKPEVKPEPKPAPLPEPEPAPLPEPEPLPLPEPEPEPEPLPEPAPLPEVDVMNEVAPEPKELEMNEKAVLSEKTPYSVLVRSYKYSQFAENDKARLDELGFEPYLLNTFDEQSFFAFNIHVGAFATKEEAEELRSQFDDMGITDTQISDYMEIESKIKRYDEVLSQEKVTFDDGLSSIPSSLPDSVKKLIQHFPANKNFPIKEISILDYDLYRLCEDKPDTEKAIMDAISSEESIHSALLATYKDELYKKDVEIFLVNATNFDYKTSSLTPVEEMSFGEGKERFECSIFEVDGEFILNGTNPQEGLFLTMKSKDFSKEEFLTFITESFTSSSLSIYPQIRRTLLVLPNANDSVQRDFVSFSFKKVDDKYAAERNYIDWSLPIVGHYLAETAYVQKNALVCLGFYDLEYDFNSKRIHQYFKDNKNKSEVSENNQPLTLNGVDGWYFIDKNLKELSLSTKSYIIAIDTLASSQVTKDDLIEVGNDLRIWKKAPVIDAK